MISLTKLQRVMGSTAFLVVCIVLVLIASFLTFTAYRTAPEAMKKVEVGREEGKIEYTVRVYPKPSTLYPSPAGPVRVTSHFFEQLTDRLEVQVVGRVAVSPPAEELEGDMQVNLLVKNEDLWSLQLETAPEVEVVEQSGEGAVFQSVFEVPVEQARQLVDTIREETGVGSRENFTIDLQTVLEYDTEMGEPQQLPATYSLAFANRLIEPRGEPMAANMNVITDTQRVRNNLNFLLFSVDIPTGRTLSVILLALSLAGVAASSWSRGRSDKQRSELDLIVEQFRPRLVVVDELETPTGAVQVRTANFESLLRIADERDRSILQLQGSGDSKTRLCVLDQQKLYYYEPSTAQQENHSCESSEEN